jgi:hypothetical protein
MLYFDGKKNDQRVAAVREGVGILTLQPGGREMPIEFEPYRKTSVTYARRIDEPFTVDTLEGEHSGKAGDYLAVGVHGEMYPIDAAVFDATYEHADRDLL